MTYMTLSNAKNRLTWFTVKKEKRGGREKQEKKKRPQRHIETPILTPLALLKIYQWDESNDTKKSHKR